MKKITILLLLATTITFAQNQSVTKIALADAFCRDGDTYKNTNFGSEGQITTKKVSSQTSSYNRKTYLKFDLTDVDTTNIKDVVLRLHNDYVEGSGFNIDIFETSATWFEGTINWANAPIFGEKVITFNAGLSGTYSEISVCKNIVKQLASSSLVSFGLYMSEISNTNNILWASRESSSGKAPELVVSYLPSNVTSVSAVQTSTNQIDLTWDASNCNTDLLIVERRTSSTIYDTLVILVQPFANGYTDTGVDNGHSYFYRITAANIDGDNARPIIVSTVGTANMEYVSTICDQPITSEVDLASLKNPILRICIETKYDNNPLEVKNIHFNLNGTTSIDDINALNIYYSGSNMEFNTHVSFGESNIKPTSGTIAASGSIQLLPGKNYFWVAAGVNTNALTGNVIDAQCEMVSLQGESTVDYIPNVSDPTGNRPISSYLSTSAIRITRLGEEIISSSGTTYAGTNLVSFSQDVLRTYNGYQYAVYWDNSKKLAVARKKIGLQKWEIIILNDYVSGSDLKDNHYNVSMGFCTTDGTIHLSYDHHSSDLNYRRSINGILEEPEKHQWTSALFRTNQDYLVPGNKITNVSYPRFITKPNGDLLFVYRTRSSGNGDNYLCEYKGNQHAWNNLGMFINGRATINGKTRSAYFNGIQYDKNGILHAAWCWRTSYEAHTNHDLNYMYSEDDGRTWKNTFAVKIAATGSTPILANMTNLVVFKIPMNRSLMNQESMCIDNNGRVHVLNGMIKDEEPDVETWGTSYPVHFYRKDDGTWQKNFMTLEAKKNRDQIACDRQNNIYLILDNNIYMASEVKNWTDWKVVAQKSLGASYWGDGTVDRSRILNDNVLTIGGAKSGAFLQVNFLIDNLYPGNGKGLTRELFSDSLFINKIKTDQDNINFEGETMFPEIVNKENGYGVKFNGTIETRFADSYSLYLTSSGKIRCKINGVSVVDDWSNSSLKEYKIPLAIYASHRYSIEIEGVFTNNSPVMKLEWESARHFRSIVPINALYQGVETNLNTGLKDVTATNRFNIYPNPTTGSLNIKSFMNSNAISQLNLYGADGSKLISESFSEMQVKEVNVNYSFLPKGIYFLEIISENFRSVEKLIIK